MSQFSDAEINLIINKENESNSTLEKNINYSSQNISSFYFENNLAVQNGKRIFLIKWGNRSNVDNWRTNAVGSLNTGLQNENKQNPVKELKSYNNLPRSLNRLYKYHTVIYRIICSYLFLCVWII